MKSIHFIIILILINFTARGQGIFASYQAVNYLPTFITAGMKIRYEVTNSSSYSGTGSTITDLMGNVNGTLANSPVYTNSSVTYLTMNGTNNYILTNNIGSVNNESAFMWVYPTGNGVLLSALGQATINTSYHFASMEITGTSIKYGIWPYTVYAPQISSSISLNTWHYVGYTYDGSTLTGYLDGTAVGTYSIVRQPPANLYLGIGATDATNLTSASGGGYGNFRFGAFHYYTRGLSANEVKLNYTSSQAKFSTSVTFSQTFTSGQAPGSLIESEWTSFRSKLTGSYSSMTLSSSTGTTITVTDPKIQDIANALRTATVGTNFSTVIGGNTWYVIQGCVQGTATANSVYLTTGGACTCAGTYTIRPMINNANWGGLGGSSCNQATQTLTVKFF
jgi:hypothetical protein